MTTLAVMKSRIASELRRDDLTSDIADAISSAIGAYNNVSMYFNEFRTNTFSTVAEQSIYTASDASWIGRILKIRYAFLIDGEVPYTLDARDIEGTESFNLWTTYSGTPESYSWYGQELHLSPIPDEVFTVRVGATLRMAEPATDSESGNVWMTEAERLIRCRAKAELYAHVIKDKDKAATQMQLAEEAFAQLRERTRTLNMVGDGGLVPSCYW